MAAGDTASIVLQREAGDGGTEFTTDALTTDQSVTLYAAAYDGEGNYIGPANVAWSSVAFPEVSGRGTSYLFEPSTVATGTIVGTSDGYTDATGTITVTVGNLASLTIVDQSGVGVDPVGALNLTTDGSVDLYAAGFDADGNYRGDAVVDWTSTGSLESITSSGTGYTFAPTSTGSGTIVATSGSISDATGTITVTGGAVSAITIRTAPDNGGSAFGDRVLTADQEVTFYAAGYDAQGNYVRDVSATWSLDSGDLEDVGGTGTSYMYAPVTSGVSGVIRADSTGLTGDVTGTITVNDGALDFVLIESDDTGSKNEVTTATISTDETLVVYAAGYDADENYISPISVTWSTTGGLDDTTASGTNFTFSPRIKGSGTIVATDGIGVIGDATGTITVTAGDTAYIVLQSEPGDGGPVFGDFSMTTDDEVTIYAAAYDADSNYVGPAVVEWTSAEFDNVSGTGTRYTFRPVSAPESGFITGTTIGGNFSDTTGEITVSEGGPAYIQIRTQPDGGGAPVGDVTTTTDADIIVYAASYDGDGNFLGNESVTWETDGTLDDTTAIGTSFTFDPITARTSGKITATSATGSDQTGVITVNVGVLAEVRLQSEPGEGGNPFPDSTITTNDVATVYSEGYDADGNWRSAQSVTWSGTDSWSTISASGSKYTFNPIDTGSGYIVGSSGSITDSTGLVTVTTGGLESIVIRTGANETGDVFDENITVQTGDSLSLFAAGYDLEGYYISDINVFWSVDGDLVGDFASTDSVSTNTIGFDALGSSRIRISKARGLDPDLVNFSGIITVEAGAPDSVAYVFGADTLVGPAGSTISDPLEVKVFDAFDNPVDSVMVYWYTTPLGVSLGGSFSNDSSLTDVRGQAESKWTLRTQVGLDTAYAAVPGVDTLMFNARVQESTADRMFRVSPSDTINNVVVRTPAAESFIIQVEDTEGNPVPDVQIRFDVINPPSEDFSFNPSTGVSNASGQVSTIFTPGSIVGEYGLTAYNENVNGSGTKFVVVNAIADDAGQMAIFAGEAQRDTVGHTVQVNPAVRVTDQYGNIVEGFTVTWSPTATASVVDANTDTDASGIASTQWILREEAGADTLTASGTGVSSVQFTATARPDIPNQITIPASLNNTTTIAGSTIRIQAVVQDRFGNRVENAEVTFTPTDQVSVETDMTDADGIAQTVYTAPAESASSVLTATVDTSDGSAEVNYTIYGIQYDPGSFEPDLVALGDTVGFSIRVWNAGPDIIPLDTIATTLSFTDQTTTYTSNLLNTSAQIDANGFTRLQFVQDTISNAMAGGLYTPKISLNGQTGTPYDPLKGTLLTDPGELSIEPLEIQTITVQLPREVRRGDTVRVSMTVLNSGSEVLNVDSVGISFNPAGSPPFQAILTSGPSQLQTDVAPEVFTFVVPVPDDAQQDTYTVDGFIRAISVTDTLIDPHAITVDSFSVVPGAVLTVEGYQPGTVSNLQDADFEVSITNDGPYDILLNRNATNISFGTVTANLQQNQAIEGGSATTTLRFESAQIDLGAGTFPGTLHLEGTENGNFYVSDTTLDDLTVQIPADIDLTAITLSATEVSQGEENQTLTMDIINNGEATARILSADSITIDYSSDYALRALSIFPLDITGGSTAQLQYEIAVDENATTGTDTFRTTISFTDQNSNSVFEESNTDIFDDWTVLEGSALSITRITSARDTVSQGQQNVAFEMVIANSGEVNAVIGSADSVGLDFRRNANTIVATNGFPVTIPADDSVTINFEVDIDDAASTGLDYISGFVLGRNVNTNAVIDEESGELETLFIERPPVMVIDYVRSEQDIVNKGQTETVRLRLTNQGDATALIDSVGLYILEEGNTVDSLLNGIPSLDGGASHVFNFDVQVNENTTDADDILILDGFYRVTDENDVSRVLSDTGAVETDSWELATPLDLAIETVSVSRDTMTWGQQGVTVTTNIRNDGSTAILLDSVRITFNDRIGTADTIRAVKQTSPALPLTIFPGNSTTLVFDVEAQTGISVTDTFVVDAEAYGVYLFGGQDGSVLSAENTDILVVQTPADVVVTAVSNPVSVGTGEDGFNVELQVVNRGSARARVNNVMLQFRNEVRDTRQYYAKNYVSPPLPFNLSGNDTSTISYTVDIAEDAPVGIDSLRGVSQYTEINRPDISGIDTSAYLSSWEVKGSGELIINFVSAEQSYVSKGQQDVPVQVQVANGGTDSIRIEQVELDIIPSAGYDPATLVNNTIVELDTGEVFVYPFLVDVLPDAESGVATLNARASGINLANAGALTRNNALVTDSWLVQDSVDIDIRASSPARISLGHFLEPAVQIRNQGEARLYLDSSATYIQYHNTSGDTLRRTFAFATFGNDTVQPEPDSTYLIDAKETYDMFFVADTIGVTETPDQYVTTLYLDGTENGSAKRFDITNADDGALSDLLIQTPAVMRIDSVYASQDTVAQGNSTEFNVVISNLGEAPLRVDSIRVAFEFDSLVIIPQTPRDTITSFAKTYRGLYTTDPAEVLGTYGVRALGYGTDFNSTTNNIYAANDLDGAEYSDSLTIISPSVVRINSITSAVDTVSQGQDSVLIAMEVENTGDVDADIDAVSLDFERNAHTFVVETFHPTIPATEIRTYEFYVFIDDQAATGWDRIRGIVERPVETINSPYIDSLLVQRPAQIVINSVTSDFSEVTLGQQDVPIRVKISNQGEAAGLLDSLLLDNLPAGSTVDALVGSLSPIPGNSTQTYNFLSDISDTLTLPQEITLGARYVARDFNDTSRVFTGNDVIQADTLTVVEEGALVVDSVYANVRQFTQGQENVTATVLLRNGGSSSVRVEDVDLVLNPSFTSLTVSDNFTPVTLAQGQFTSVQFDINSATSPLEDGPFQLQAQASGTDNITSLEVTSNTAISDTIYLQTPADIVVTDIQPRVPSIGIGTSDSVYITLNNQGIAEARVENVLLQFKSEVESGNEYYVKEYVQPARPFNLSGASDTTVAYFITVPDNETTPLGIDSLRAVSEWSEINRPDLDASSTSAYLGAWTVTGVGDVVIERVETPRDYVSTGQQDIPVTVYLRNNGTDSVRVDQVRLEFTRGLYEPSSVVNNIPLYLNTGEMDSAFFNVAVDGNSPTGVATITAAADFTNLSTDSGFVALINNQPDSWIVQRAFDLAIRDNQPRQVSTGQVFTPMVRVRNNGEASLVIDSTASYLEFSDGVTQRVNLDSALLDNETPVSVIGPNDIVHLYFGDTTIVTASSYDLTLHLEGIENGDTTVINTTANLQPLVVQNAAVLAIQSVTPDTDPYSQGMNATFSVNVQNDGEADLRVDSLLVFYFQGSDTLLVDTWIPTENNTISGGGNRSYPVDHTFADTVLTGGFTLNAFGYGYDLNSPDDSLYLANDTDGAVSPGSFTILTAPQVEVTDVISVLTSVTQGQTNIPLDVTITNSGGTPVDILSIAVRPDSGSYVEEWPPSLPQGLASGTSEQVQGTLEVRENSATGNDTIYVDVQYENTLSGEISSFTSSTYHAWVIESTSLVEILSLDAEPTRVSVGQSAIPVNVILKNVGGSEVVIDSVIIDAKQNPDNYSGHIETFARSLANNEQDEFPVPLDVIPSAITGPDTLYARVVYTEISTSEQKSVLDSIFITDEWTVQSRPVVLVDSVSVTPRVVSTGQEGLTGSLYIRNVAAPFRASAQLNRAEVQMLLGDDGQNAFFDTSRTASPSLPLVLAPGNRTRIDYRMNVSAAADTGTYVADASIAWEDVNDPVYAPEEERIAIDKGSLVVQDSASIVVDAIWVVPDTVSQGQTHARVYVDIANQGSAPVEITGTSLVFDQPVWDFNELIQEPTTPFIIPGNRNDTLIYAIEIPVQEGGTSVYANITGKDVNSGESITVQSGLTEIFIQTPANVDWADVPTVPQVVETDSSFSFVVRVVNTGQAAVVLDSNQTVLKLANLSPIPLSGLSEQVIKPSPDTTVLTFRERNISIEQGTYPLTIDVKGMTNGANYELRNIGVGTFSFGSGIIIISAINVDPQQVDQGRQGIIGNMYVSSSAEALAIDSANTKLIFREENAPYNIVEVQNLRPVNLPDTLRRGNNQLIQFTFDLDDQFPLGTTYAYGRISLDDSSFIAETTPTSDPLIRGTLIVSSSAKASYVEGSFSPDSLVNRQVTSFIMNFNNTGTSNLALNPDSSFIEILDTAPVIRRYLSGKFTIGGASSAFVSFDTLTINDVFTPGVYDVRWHLNGQSQNGARFDKDSVLTDVFEVVPGGRIVFENIQIVQDVVRQGQDSVQVIYTLQNAGETPAEVSRVDHKFFRNGVSSTGWTALESILFPDIITPGTSKDYSKYFRLSAAADTGIVIPEPVATYKVIKPVDMQPIAVSDTSMTILSSDSVRVVNPALLRIDSLKLIAVNGNNVNVNQDFDLYLKLRNNGKDFIEKASVLFSLLDGSTVIDTFSIDFVNIGPDLTTDSTVAYSGGITTAKLYSFKTEITSAIDRTTESEVAVGAPIDNIEMVNVQNPSRLRISAAISAPEGAVDSTVSLGQEFTISAQVSNLTQNAPSSFGPGALRIAGLTDRYALADGETVDKPFTQTSQTALNWIVKANEITQGDPDLPRVEWDQVPVDSNSAPEFVRTDNPNYTVPVSTVPSAAVNAILLSIIDPDDPAISTGQTFTVEATVEFNQAVLDTQRTIRIFYPQGYTVDTVAIQNLNPAQTTTIWKVTAPGVINKGEVRNDSIYVTAYGFDENSGDAFSASSDKFGFTLSNRASIALNASIDNPEGAKNGVVSTDQDVILNINVTSTFADQTGFDNSGTISLKASGGVVFAESGTSTLSIPNFTKDPYLRTIRMPETDTTAVISVYIEEDNLPRDSNSGLPVAIQRDSININLQIIPKADLRLTAATVPVDTHSVILRTIDKPFTVNAIVRNSGLAGVRGSDSLRIDLSKSRSILTDEDPVKTYTLAKAVSWVLQAPLTPTIGTDYDTVIVFAAGATFDANTADTDAFSKARDTLVFNIISIEALKIADVRIDNVLIDEEDPQDVVFSTQQGPIEIKAGVEFPEERKLEREVTLFLPEGYTSLDQNLTRFIPDSVNIDTITWRIRAGEVSGSDSIRIQSSAVSEIDNSLDTKWFKVPIVTQRRTSLALLWEVIEPEGARDLSVAVGDVFTIEATVTKTGESQLDNNEVTLEIEVDESKFALVENNDITAAARKTQIITEPFLWSVRASTEAANILNSTASSDQSGNDLDIPSNTQPDLNKMIVKDNSDMRRSKRVLKKELSKKLFDMMSRKSSVSTVAAISGDSIRIQFVEEDLPNDINTSNPVVMVDQSVAKQFEVEEAAEFTSINLGPDRTYSTNQAVTITVETDFNENLKNPTAFLSIPSSILDTEEPVSSDVDTTGAAPYTASWDITIPPNYDGTGTETFSVVIIGEDRNSNDPVSSDPASMVATIQQRPVLAMDSEIIAPQSAINNKEVSLGQEVVIEVMPRYFSEEPANGIEWSAISGTGSITLENLEPSGFTLKAIEGNTQEKSFTTLDEMLRWTLIAPNKPQAAFGLSFVYNTLPNDANSALNVEVDRNTGFKTVPLTVRQKLITINMLEDFINSDSASYNQGDTGPLFAFEVSNRDFTEELNIDSIAFSFLEPGGENTMMPSFIRNMIDSIFVVDTSFYQENKRNLLKGNGVMIDEPYVRYGLGEESGASPLGMKFPLPAVIDTNTSTTFVVLANFLPNADLRSFSTRLNHVHAFDVNRDIPLPVIDSEGTLMAQSRMFTSRDTISVISRDEKAVFGNFPNPFGGSRGEFTRFLFQTNNTADVALRIYSLVGELVRSYEQKEYFTGVHRNIIWDGKNDQGNVVLNGVYVAIIEIKPKSGPGKIYKTKVAFIK